MKKKKKNWKEKRMSEATMQARARSYDNEVKLVAGAQSVTLIRTEQKENK